MKRAALLLVVLLCAGPTLGGVTYTAATPDYHQASSPWLSSYPYSVHMRQDWAGADGASFSVTDTDVVTNWPGVIFWSSGSNNTNWHVSPGGSANTTEGQTTGISAGYSTTTAIGVDSDTRICVQDGDWAGRGTTPSDKAFGSGYDVTSIATLDRSTGPSNNWGGRVDLVAVYGIALSEDQEGSLSLGAWPPYVASASLTHLVLMEMGSGTTIQDVVGGDVLTATGSPAKSGSKNLCPRPGMQQ